MERYERGHAASQLIVTVILALGVVNDR